MRNSFDWTPYRRSTVGFDRLFDFLETGGSAAENYPPFDIERVADDHFRITVRSEEHTSELQSLMRISYAVFCLKKKKTTKTTNTSLQRHDLTEIIGTKDTRLHTH